MAGELDTFGAMRACARACLALALITPAACAPAEAEDDGWPTVVANDQARTQVQRSSLSVNGVRVSSVVKVTPRKPWTTNHGRPYAYQLSERVDDCSTGAFAITANVYRSADGAVVEQDRFAPADVKLGANFPGTVGGHITTSICKLAGLPEPLMAAVPLDEVKPDDWRPLASDPAQGVRVFLLNGSVKREEPVAMAVLRSDFAAPHALEDGRKYQQIVARVFVDCESMHHAYESNDYYASSGKLLDVELVDPADTFQRVSPGELSGRLADALCPRNAR